MTITNTTRQEAATNLRQAISNARNTLQLLEELANNVDKWHAKDSREVATVLLRVWGMGNVADTVRNYITALSVEDK